MSGDQPVKPEKDKDQTKPGDSALTLIQAAQDGQRPPNVAPLALEPGQKSPSLDPFKAKDQPGAPKPPGRATYGTDRTPDGERLDRTQQPVTPDFRETHRQYERNPNDRYSTPTSAAAAQSKDLNALEITHKAIQQVIAKRGLAHDPFRDPDFMTAGGFQHTAGATLAAMAGGAMSPVYERGLTAAANRTVIATAPYLESENAFKRNLAKMADAPARAWQTHVNGTGDLVPIKAGSEQAEAMALRQTRIMEAEAALKEAVEEEAKLKASQRLQTLRNPLSSQTVAAAEINGLWSKTEADELVRFSAAETSRAQAIAGRKIAEPMGVASSMRTGLFGAAMSYGAILADRSLNEATGGKAQESWNTEQLLGPMALVASKTTMGKGVALAGSLVASRAVDKVFGAAPEAWNAPTGNTDWVDAGLLGTSIALASRIPSAPLRLGVVGLGVGLAKGIHAIGDNTTGFKDTYYDTKERTVVDARERSASSLDRMTNSYTDLGKKTDYLMRLVMASDAQMRAAWNLKKPDGSPQMTQEQKLLAYRQDGVMRRSMGDAEVGKGTQVLENHTFNYILPGYNLDLNGRAADLYIRSTTSINGAHEFTRGIIDYNKDSSHPPVLVEGTQPKEEELKALKDYNADTRKKLTELFEGKHDIPGAVKDLAKYAGADTEKILKSIVFESDRMVLQYAEKGKKARDLGDKFTTDGNTRMAELANAEKVDCQQMLAKLYRDQAVAYLAMAKNKLDHGDDGTGAKDLLYNAANNPIDLLPGNRRKSFNGAQGAIMMAERFGDPNNPDLQQLRQQFNELTDRVDPTIRANYGNPHLNPLNVDNGLQRGK
ncbi:MAG: hypothetical protein KA392_12005 [Candidatus Obscuribacter sp.]|nr:hypothetical protein [Candidatus Obscuribacter sp.]